MGSTAAAVMIEGGNRNTDWFKWCEEGHILDGSHVMRGIDHWNRYADDIKIMKELNHDSCCMSVEWSRIEPEKGKYDLEAIKHYRDEISLLLQNGIKPLVSLYHFSLPLWLAEMGGWENPEIVDIFVQFTRFVLNQLGDLVSDWITINDANLTLVCGYLWAWWPPGKKDAGAMVRASRNMSISHIKGYQEIHKIRAEKKYPGTTKVGLSLHLRVLDPIDDKFMNKLMAKMVDYFMIDVILAAMTTGKFGFPLGLGGYPVGKGKFYDFIGVNYFTRDMVSFKLNPAKMFFELRFKEGAETNDGGWEIYPEGMYRVCKKVYAKYKVPLYITENGIYNVADDKKPKFIYDNLWQIHRLIQEGIPVERYYHWTLIDLFECHSGERCRLGLVENDFETQTRTIRRSGRLYGEICGKKAVTQEMIKKYLSGK
ncbi:MAG: family 1 glycosylhydrolase [Firmicutes bacterium]|nr:family 1 glycosylhydrolase [Bacillota bacterium]